MGFDRGPLDAQVKSASQTALAFGLGGISLVGLDGRFLEPNPALCRLLAGAGGTLAVRLTTPQMLVRIVRLAGVRLTAMEAVRLVPLAGQIVAAGIGYWSVNTVAMRHIAQCERIVAELEGRKGTA